MRLTNSTFSYTYRLSNPCHGAATVTMISKALFTVFFVLLFSSLAVAEILSVKGDGVNLRTEPSSSSPVKWEYGKGFPLKILQRKGEWCKVSDFEQDTGWIHASVLSKNRYVIVKVNKNSNKNINIRKGPSTKEKIVGRAFYGVVLQLLEKKKDWVKVRHESGLEGWVATNLLWGL